MKYEEVTSVEAPPKVRAEDAPRETFERKKDYLEGFLAAKPQALSGEEPGGELYEAVLTALREIYDPEIPVNIYELGLIYDLTVAPTAAVHVRMTLTTPMCPAAGTLPGEVESKIRAVKPVTAVKVELVWDPPWDKDRMSEAAKLQLGIDD